MKHFRIRGTSHQKIKEIAKAYNWKAYDVADTLINIGAKYLDEYFFCKELREKNVLDVEKHIFIQDSTYEKVREIALNYHSSVSSTASALIRIGIVEASKNGVFDKVLNSGDAKL